jgi:hypothetical protein
MDKNPISRYCPFKTKATFKFSAWLSTGFGKIMLTTIWSGIRQEKEYTKKK